MKYVLTSEQMKACDSHTIRKMQLPAAVLMERAALAAVEELHRAFPGAQRVLVLCGSGNNGGDGFAVARLLLLEGTEARVCFAGREQSLTKEAALQKKIYENYGGIICRNPVFSEYTILVDALFGIGLSRNVEGGCAGLLQAAAGSGLPVLALDMPSGISADTGAVMGTALRANVTVSFGFAKRGQLLYPGTEYCGRLVVRDVGITAEALRREEEPVSAAFFYEEEDLRLLPKRSRRSNKGSYGRVLLIGGAPGMAGAAVLAGRGAYRTGSGLVRICASKESQSAVQMLLPEALFTAWPAENAEQSQSIPACAAGLGEALSWATVVGIGPGLGTSGEAEALVRSVLQGWKGTIVADADALNLLSAHEEYWSLCKASVIVTPHPGEMSRLTGRTAAEIQADIPGAAERFADARRVICVLKDARTAVSDGKRLYLNTSGNDGMAVGGSGDVLTGIICGLLAQGMEPYEAACMGVYLHGLAGDAARRRLGARSMLAGDIAESLYQVLKPQEKLL